MFSLNTGVKSVGGIGEKKAQALGKLGVFTLYDLVSFFPRAYEDRTVIKPISMLMAGESAGVRAMVANTPTLSRVRRGMELVKLRAVDDSGTLDITYFNQSYIRDQLIRGETYTFYGKVSVSGAKRAMTNPVFEREGSEGTVTGCIVPVYRLTAGLSQKVIINAVRQALEACGDSLPDALPTSISDKYNLAQVRFSYENIHFPADFTALSLARRRLIFEELFVLASALGLLRGHREELGGIPLPEADIEEFYAAMPFRPTDAQRKVVSEALSDMRSGRPMSRLVQGDVGSGKTLC
ncbi:MAG: ATP-dependent DNA helicase RecG, partial [Clostridia bacterium]|nr:ATP-dependent DNA helicase RecG [Clostridia bacterium]